MYYNKIFNNCVILEPVDVFKTGAKALWKIKCHCGNIFNARPDNLKSNNTKSCGCLNIKRINSQNFNWQYKVYNNCEILTPVIENKISCEDKWNVKCFCGKIFQTKPKLLKSGNTKSCGCFKRENAHKLYSHFNYIGYINEKTKVEIIGPVDKNKTNFSNHFYFAKCPRCGIIFQTLCGSVRDGLTKSCGCLSREVSSKTILKYLKSRRLKQGLQEYEYLTNYNQLLRSIYFYPIRKLIYKVDDYKCQLCSSNYKLHIHHINFINQSYNLLDIYNINNLITLCKECHMNLAHNIAPIIRNNIKLQLLDIIKNRNIQLILDDYNKKIKTLKEKDVSVGFCRKDACR